MNIGHKLAAVAGGALKAVSGIYGFLKLFMLLAIAAFIFGSIYYFYHGTKSAVNVVVAPLERITGTTPIPENLPEKVSENRLKCRAYALLADFKGAPKRFEADKRRVLRTISKYAQSNGVDECEIFSRQMELVVPGSTRPGTFRRHFWYIEMEFSAYEREAALQLARELAEKPDPAWQAIVMIRPYRSGTNGNQSPEEIKKIESSLTEVKIDGPTDFRFFKAKD